MGAGYIISILSVLLLGAAAWQQAARENLTLVLLLLGMATSIVGMLMRFIVHRREQAEKERAAP